MNSTSDDIKLLKNLSVTIVYNPRATTKELAEAVGISKATLHRAYGTRRNMENILMAKAFRGCKEYNIYYRNIF